MGYFIWSCHRLLTFATNAVLDSTPVTNQEPSELKERRRNELKTLPRAEAIDGHSIDSSGARERAPHAQVITLIVTGIFPRVALE